MALEALFPLDSFTSNVLGSSDSIDAPKGHICYIRLIDFIRHL